jgi:hypothetical protein
MQLLTLKEAAKWLRISESQLLAMRMKKIGPTWRMIGGRVVYDVKDLESFVLAQPAR